MECNSLISLNLLNFDIENVINTRAMFRGCSRLQFLDLPKLKNEKINTPEENYEAASLELALYRIMKRDHDAVKAAMSEGDEKELSQIAEEKMPRMLGFIDRQMRRMAVRSSLRRQGHRILQTAAVVVLILNIGFGTAVATSGNVRHMA